MTRLNCGKSPRTMWATRSYRLLYIIHLSGNACWSWILLERDLNQGTLNRTKKTSPHKTKISYYTCVCWIHFLHSFFPWQPPCTIRQTSMLDSFVSCRNASYLFHQIVCTLMTKNLPPPLLSLPHHLYVWFKASSFYAPFSSLPSLLVRLCTCTSVHMKTSTKIKLKGWQVHRYLYKATYFV